MTLTSDRLDELRQRLAGLRTGFGEVGARAAAAAAELGDSVAPAEAFVEALRGTATEFDALRQAIVHELSTFPNTPDPAKLSTLKALDAVLTAMERVRAEHARRAAWEAARDGKLGRGGEAPGAPEPPPAPVVAAPSQTPATVATPVASAPGAGRTKAPPGSPLVVEIRMSGQQVQVETPEEQREREELLERLAADGARWWVGARAGWESLVQRGVPAAEAMRETLKRFPHLFSVPLS